MAEAVERSNFQRRHSFAMENLRLEGTNRKKQSFVKRKYFHKKRRPLPRRQASLVLSADVLSCSPALCGSGRLMPDHGFRACSETYGPIRTFMGVFLPPLHLPTIITPSFLLAVGQKYSPGTSSSRVRAIRRSLFST
jgi:hypothetical protein